MNDFIKQVYLTIFTIRYRFKALFIKQKDNTILFISEFPYTLDALKDKYPNSSFTKLEFNPQTAKVKTQIKYFCQAKYIYTDNYNVFMPYLSKKKIKIQVWHAPVAIKKIGFMSNEIKQRPIKAKQRYQKVYDAYNYYLCPSPHMEEVYSTSFKVPKEKILNYGYVKLDYYLSQSYKIKALQYEKDMDILLNKLNIVYLPTFRTNEQDNQAQITFVNHLVDKFASEYNIWYKFHQKIRSNAKDCQGKMIYERDLEYILKFADIVITDYSSIFIEALMHKAALVYYLYDIDNYQKERGLNISFEELPGDKAYSYTEVEKIIENKTYQKLAITDLPTKYIPYNLAEKNSEASIKIIKKFYNK